MASGSYPKSSTRRAWLRRRRPSVRTDQFEASKTLDLERLEPRQLLAQLVAIQPNDGSILEDGQTLSIAPTALRFRFDETPPPLDPATIHENIVITRSGLDGIFGNANDVVIQPGFIGLGDNANEAIVRFAETLPDDMYRIDAYGERLDFELDLGAQVVAVVPQPVRRVGNSLTQARDQIVVYFNPDDLQKSSVEDPRYYQLIFTNDTATNTDGGPVHRPTRVVYDAAGDRATLTFAAPLDELSSGPGTYRLRIGTDEAAPQPPVSVDVPLDPGSSFESAHALGVLNGSQIVHSSIDATQYPLEFPGGNDDPGHRDLPLESGNQHLDDTVNLDGDRLPTTDEIEGVSTIGFVFRDVYGVDPFGVPLRNLITDAQRQRTREVFELYGQYIGAQFFEADEAVLPDLVDAGVPFFSIVTGDLRALSPTIVTGPGGVIGLAGAVLDPVLGPVPTAIMDNAESWDNSFGASWFETAMHEIGHLLGLGHTYDLPPGTIMGSFNEPGYTPEPYFPGHHDIVHAQRLYRPEGQDIDLYRFEIASTGLLTAETFAERRQNYSFLDSVLTLYREDAAGNRVLVARNDNYYSKDSFIDMVLTPGTYFVGVSASGNNQYDPVIEETGLNGRTEGKYDLRLTFRPDVTQTIVDTTGTPFDGDADGVPGGVYNFWLRAQSPSRTLIVDKSASVGGDGSLSRPFRRIATALSAARPGDIVRVVGNGGADRNLDTLQDNLPYEIGFGPLNQPLADGATLEVPKDVTMMIDEGAIFKLRRARIGVGSSSPGVDRSGSALQVLGTPDHSVFFTSINDESTGLDSDPLANTPRKGDWGGIIFRHDVDQSEERFVYENEGIFLNYVNHADMRFGGGEVVIESVQQVVTPLEMLRARPTLSHNVIRDSADAAMSADPDSFEETNFHAPEFQKVPFTSDVTRIGPEIHNNVLLDNSINGLFVRIKTPAGRDLKSMTVSGRWDDTDIVHVISENLVIAGTPGGPTQRDARAPDVSGVTSTAVPGGSLAAGFYTYKITFLREDGSESAASDETLAVPILGPNATGTVRLSNLPLTFDTNVVGRRIYRSAASGISPYQLVGETPLSQATFTDDGSVTGGVILDEGQLDLAARLDARLAIDPAVVVKMDGAYIEATLGGQLIAEARDGFETIFTSILDDRYGAGGTFDTSNDTDTSSPDPGDWAGLYIGHTSQASFDHVLIAYAGGVTKVEGSFTAFNALEIHQAQVRVTNSRFDDNASGFGGQAPTDRFGRGFNDNGTIFVRGAQPIIVNNTITNGRGPAINANPAALSAELVTDWGRSTGLVSQIDDHGDNQGPMIRGNRLGNNAVNGMVVRGEILNTESVWDDTDIVHVVYDEIVTPDFHTYGGLRLESSATASLVVKLDGAEAGLTANGRPLDNDDRIGGRLQVVGQPGFPVVLTSLRDDSVGAGFDQNGRVLTDTDNNGDRFDPGGSLPTGPEVNNGTLIDNDVPINTPGFFQANPGAGGQLNATGVTVQTQAAILQNQNLIAQFINYVDVGRNGSAFNLAATNITLPPTLVANDVVASEGTFVVGTVVNPQTITWRVETSFRDGDPTAYNEVSFRSDRALGNLRLINYFDPQIFVAAGDILFSRGTAGQDDFRAYVFDNNERLGFGHGGILQAGEGLVNARFAGWASDIAVDLNAAIVGPGAAYSVQGNVDQISLPPVDDPDLGRVFGPQDVTTAFAWDIQSTSTTALMTSFVQLVSRNPQSMAGDWRGLRLEELAHDRNVEVTTEREAADARAPGVNALPSTAQFLGELAPHEKAGDDNRRLGFEVHGFLNDTNDIDVYSFRADGGTEVWIDLDRTTTSLDSMVELIDANGTVIARSDNSYAEKVGIEDVFGLGRSMDRSIFNGKDRYSVNIHDAGLRVILPGSVGSTNVYHVRVRSAGPEAASQITAGVTRGAYQMQIRLQEMDELPGSTVKFADIRNAVNGIEILGQPTHSPLLGEVSEVAGDNQTRATAQNLGNILAADRGAVDLVGSISDNADIDWYQFDVQLEGIQRIPGGPNAPPTYAAITIDVDYTDGLARPNTKIHIFDDAGVLVYSSDNSSIPDDRPAGAGADPLTDLSTGSAGSRDPFLGTVQLPEGTYYMAVTSPSLTPAQLTANLLLRAEPVNSINRIGEDRILTPGGSGQPKGPTVPIMYSANQFVSIFAPNGEDLADGETLTLTDVNGVTLTFEFDSNNIVRGRNIPIVYDPILDTSTVIAAKIGNAIVQNGPSGIIPGGGLPGEVVLEGATGVSQKPGTGTTSPDVYVSKPGLVPFYLGDLTMFVTVDSGIDQTRLITVDPYSGGTETTIGIFNAHVNDIAIKPDGRIYGFSNPENMPTDATTGNYHQIDIQSPTTQDMSMNLGDDGIMTYQDDMNNPGTAIQSDDGVRFQGVTFGQINSQNIQGFAIGNRGLPMPNMVAGPTTNLLYEFNVDTGAAFTAQPDMDRQDVELLEGGGTQIRERGQLDTTVDPIGPGNSALITSDATEIGLNGQTIANITDGLQFTMDDGAGNVLTFEMNSGPEVRFIYSPGAGAYVRDGDTFTLDGVVHEFDTGSVLVVNALNGNGIVDGETFTITDNQTPLVARTFEFDDGTGLPIGAGHVRVPFNASMDQAGLINTIIGSVNAVGNFNIEASLLPNSNRISLRGESATVGAVTTSAGIGVEGTPGGTGILVQVEENSTTTEFGDAITTFVPGASYEGTRMNFSGRVTGNFTQIVNRGVFTVVPNADGNVSGGAIGVDFQAADSPRTIAQKIVAEITANSAVNATARATSVNLRGGAFFVDADSPLRVGGVAPGGNFTGLAIIGGVLYGVTGPDDTGQGGGGLYQILDPITNMAVADYIETSSDLLTGGRDAAGLPTGGPIQFAALSAGPDNMNGGQFAEALFAMDVFGNMYAMDLMGNLLPVFMNSQVSVPTYIPNATGFAFSTLDINLWHSTDTRNADAGHGVEEAPDGSREAEPDAGNLSLRFGFEDPNTTPGNWAGVNDPLVRNSYDFPGGANGSITTNSFSLKDYDATDQPVLYFTYFIDTEQADGDFGPPPFMRDSVRVFLSDDDGAWQLLATNNSFTGGGMADDEFDYTPFAVQELYDNTGWRQARIDLSPYGGRENLRLRFDFSSAGSLDIAGPFTGGDELRAIPGERLRDGDTFTLQNAVDFTLQFYEFDLGYTFVVPTGAAMADGQTLSVSDGVNPSVVLELDLGDGVTEGNQAVLFDSGQSARELAMSLEDAILRGFGKGVEPADLAIEQNDTMSQPVTTTYTSGYIVGRGVIGDNPALVGPNAGLDVDLIEIHAEEGQRIDVDIDTDPTDFDALLDSYVRIFDASGNEVAFNDNGLAPGETGAPFDSFVSFVAPQAGIYYVGISGGGNTTYSADEAGSGTPGMVGEYRMEIYLQGVDSPVETHLNGNRLNLQGVVDITQSAGSALVVDGAPGTAGLSIPIHADLSDDEVAMAIRRALASTYGSGDPLGIAGYSDVIRIHGHTVLDPGPLGISVDALTLANGLAGDQTGAFYASTLPDGTTNADFPGFLRGLNNAFEGVYIDDIVIGFAERGEMYTAADANDQFVAVDPLPAEEILVGDYQIEFRLSPFYGIKDPLPVPTLILTETFDASDRLSSAVSLIAPSGDQIADGTTFIVGDGTHNFVFEYDDPTLRNGITAGNIPVVFRPSDTAAVVANTIRDAINSSRVQNVADVRAESKLNSDRIDLFGSPVVDIGQNVLTSHLEESNDTIGEATPSFIRPGRNQRFRADGELGDNPLVNGGLDVDMVSLQLAAGDRVTVDFDSLVIPVDGVLRLFDAAGNEVAMSDNAPGPGETSSSDPYLVYAAAQAGTYYLGISGADNVAYDPNAIGSGVVGAVGPYEIEIVVGGDKQPVFLEINNRFGDTNIHRDQGQILIDSTRIKNSSGYGILVDAGQRQAPGNFGHQGPPRLLFEKNVQQLAPGVTIKNNVISYNRLGGIFFGGDAQDPTLPSAAVPFGRIVNNSLIGGRPSELPELLENLPLGVGIDVGVNASPTLLNNIVANFQIGIDVDPTSLSTVIGGMVYQSNIGNSTGGLGDFPIVLGPNDPLFVNRDRGNFNLAEGSRAIDSSIDSLRDRPALVFVSEPIGVEVSPILAPEMDITGLLRVDDPDVDTPAGLGDNVFKDRGAIDRADFLGPSASLIVPRDNDPQGVDRNPAPNVVQINQPRVLSFDIQLTDGLNESQRQGGTGVDPDSVSSERVTVLQNGALLAEGVDYTFAYDVNSGVIRLTPLTGVWKAGRVYEIQLDNSDETGIRDLANNLLQPNEPLGRTVFTVSIGGEDQDFGDAPDVYPTLLLDSGASHVIEAGFQLGSVVTAEPDGQPSVGANADIGDDGVVFVDSIVPGLTAEIRVTASQAGRLDAWLDLNRDGDWSDVGEYIFQSVSVRAGVNTLNVAIPESADLGVSYARFRLSREGGLQPSGLALNGEVEDYQVAIVSEQPWQNPDDPLDVNGDGFVVPLDALLVINELNNRQVSDSTGLLPNPPVEPDTPDNVGYIDVDGDGYCTPRDALFVINDLNSQRRAAVAAEGESPLDNQALQTFESSSVDVTEDDLGGVRILAAAALSGNSASSTASSDTVDSRAVDEVVNSGAERILLDAALYGNHDPDWMPVDDARFESGGDEEWIDSLVRELEAGLRPESDPFGDL